LDFSKEFVLKWFFNLFIDTFLSETLVLRIFDNYLIFKEIFLYKVAVAILKCYEFELKNSTFQKIAEICYQTMHLISDDMFFSTIDSI